MNTVAAYLKTRERMIILLLCLLAAVHVCVFSAAFPFFNNVDEQAHFDLVVRYAQGNIPRVFDAPRPESMPYLAVFNTPEYLHPLNIFPDGKVPPPPWTLSREQLVQHFVAVEKRWEQIANHEAAQPPLYYAIAGGWWRLGGGLGLHDGVQLYWLRFLNILFVVALVLVSARVAREIFPADCFIRLAVPALVAFLPQTAFYSINNDILSPLTFAAAFLLLLKFQKSESPAPRLAALAGLALAMTFLAKISNLPLLFIAGIFLAWKIFELAQNGKLRANLYALGVLTVCAAVPITAWMIWCRLNFGDLTGTALKIQALGWTNKPFAEWFQHPLFTLHGLVFFLFHNIATSWQGEFVWRGQPLVIHGVSLVYAGLTLLFLLSALVALFKPAATMVPGQRSALGFSFACCVAVLGFLALLSVKYDFHDCFYPSRISPYFTSGRLMLGALIPFLILFAYGFDFVLSKFSLTVKFAALGILLAFMLAAEITTDWQIFPNAYNWFHM